MTMPLQAEAVIVMLTAEQLDAEIAEAEAMLCCSTLLDASRALCGCGGRAASYLTRLRAEAVRRAEL
jgi:hypothetical protein